MSVHGRLQEANEGREGEKEKGRSNSTMGMGMGMRIQMRTKVDWERGKKRVKIDVEGEKHLLPPFQEKLGYQ